VELVAAPDPAQSGFAIHRIVERKGKVTGNAEDIGDADVTQARKNVMNDGPWHHAIPSGASMSRLAINRLCSIMMCPCYCIPLGSQEAADRAGRQSPRSLRLGCPSGRRPSGQ